MPHVRLSGWTFGSPHNNKQKSFELQLIMKLFFFFHYFFKKSNSVVVGVKYTSHFWWLNDMKFSCCFCFRNGKKFKLRTKGFVISSKVENGFAATAQRSWWLRTHIVKIANMNLQYFMCFQWLLCKIKTESPSSSIAETTNCYKPIQMHIRDIYLLICWFSGECLV